MTAQIVGEDILIQTQYAPEMRSLGAKWDLTAGLWRLPATRMNAKLVSDALPGEDALSVPLDTPATVSDTRLYPYQRDAAARLATCKHGLLVCLSPGLGKTAVAIAAADIAVPDDRIIVVAPASLLRTWEREIGKWSTVKGGVYVVQGKLDFAAAKTARWIVMSWDKMTREADALGKGWPVVILDESVLAKSRTSKRFKAMDKLRRTISRVWLLSGSPTTRYADDLWAQLHLIWPRAYSSYWRFAERYCVVEETPWARVVTATKHGRDAAAENSDMMLVVNQEDVLDLPEYLFEQIDVDLAGKQKTAYDSMAKSFIAELSDGTEVVAANEIAKLVRLQQIASYWDGESAKHDALMDVIESFEPPYLIWTHWVAGAEQLAFRLHDEGYDVRHVGGNTTPRRRDEYLESFKRGEFPALVLSLGVGKFGHTFTNVKTVFSVDRTFNADDYFQSLHRVRRIGLTHRPVWTSLTARGTVDELTVGDNLQAKLESIAKMTRADLASLLKGMGR